MSTKKKEKKEMGTFSTITLNGNINDTDDDICRGLKEMLIMEDYSEYTPTQLVRKKLKEVIKREVPTFRFRTAS